MRFPTTALAATTLITPLVLASPAGAAPDVEHVPLEVAGSINDVDVASDSDTGNSVVVWSDGPDLDAALLDVDGDVLVGPISIPELGAVNHAAIERTDDGWVVVYSSGWPQPEIRSRNLTDDLLAGPSTQITPTTGNDEQWEYWPDLAWLPEAGELLVTWHSSVRYASGRYETIRVRPLSGLGTPTGSATTLISEDFLGSQHRSLTSPEIDASPDGHHALVAVRGDVAGVGLAEGDHEVVARPIDSAGLPTGPLSVVSDLAIGGDPGSFFTGQDQPSVAAFGDGYLVAYRGDDGAGRLAYGRSVDLGGVAVDADEQELVEGAGVGRTVSVAPNGAGGVIAAADDQWPGALRTQRIERVGASISPTSSAVLLSAPGATVIDVAGDGGRAVIGSVAGGHVVADLWTTPRVAQLLLRPATALQDPDLLGRTRG